MTINFIAPVPADLNLEALVARNWGVVRSLINNGFPYQTYIDLIEARLKEYEQLRGEGRLAAGFDWEGDYLRARGSHKVNLDWISHNVQSRSVVIDWWLGYAARAEDYGSKLAQSGLSLIFAFHGAVVLGCIKVLTEPKVPVSPIETEARWAFALGMIGLLMVASGKLILIQYLQKLTVRLRQKVSPTMAYPKLKALPRYVARYGSAFAWADRLIYGSLGLFVAYASVLTIVITSR